MTMYMTVETPVTKKNLKQAVKEEYMGICKEKKFNLFSTDEQEACPNLFIAYESLKNGTKIGRYHQSHNADELCVARIKNILHKFTGEVFYGNSYVMIDAEPGFIAGNYSVQDVNNVCDEILKEEIELRSQYFIKRKLVVKKVNAQNTEKK